LDGDTRRVDLDVERAAAFSRDGRYRYALWREWDAAKPCVLFIGLNPSSADDRRDDPTIRRCTGFARRWGFGRLAVGNLFALRTPHPSQLRRVPSPVGPRNDRWLQSPQCLGTTKGGAPRHPLYVRKDVPPRDLAVERE
jgi:hypothetical protein